MASIESICTTWQVAHYERVIDARGGDIKRLQWSPDGSLLAAAYAGSPAIRVFNATGKMVYEELLPADAWSVSFSDHGRMAVPVSDRTIHIYLVADGTINPKAVIAASLSDPRGVQFSPDGKLLAVGYLSRQSRLVVQVDVFDVAARTRAKSFTYTDIPEGNLRSVAWQSDGSAIYAGGSGYRGKSSFVVKRITWPQGKTDDIIASTNSITDLLPLSGGRVIFATAEPSWGFLDGAQSTTMVAANSAQFFEAGVLKISSDATQVSWRVRPGSKVIYFNMATRRIMDGMGEATIAATPSSVRVWVSAWENQFHPKVGGTAIAMQPTEVSRTVAVLADASGLFLGTSRTLRRLDSEGAERWSIPLATEARAVNVTEDGKIVVVGMLDGTIVWRRTTDGSVLLSLFATPGGKWVLWTEQGYYDVGLGAEHLIGWVVNRANGEQADFYDMSRFRDKYYRPDIVDRMLTELDESKAIAVANAERKQRAAHAEDAVQQRVQEMTASEPIRNILPPVVTLLSPAVIESTDTRVSISYQVLNQDPNEQTSMIVRADGRPHQAYQDQPPARRDGVQVGRLLIDLPEKDTVVQLFARNMHGISTPATFAYRPKLPPLVVARSLAHTPVQSQASASVAKPELATAPVPGSNATVANGGSARTGNSS